MNKKNKSSGKQTGNKVQNLLNKATAFLNKSGNLLNSNLVNFDYKDAEGNIVFSTETEEDTLAVGDTVTLADGNTEGTFTLDDGRTVTVVDNTVTEIADEDGATEEVEALNGRIEELENALRESETVITELRNHLQSDFTPGKRIVTKQNPSNAKKTVEELKAEAQAKRDVFKNRKPSNPQK
jgi:transcription elongation GreA/GreB family factor